MNSIQGKRVIITGPTSGVGKEIAVQLAALGAELNSSCRDLQKGNEVRLKLSNAQAHPNRL